MRIMIMTVVFLFGMICFSVAEEVIDNSGGILKVDWSDAKSGQIKRTRSAIQKAIKNVTMPVYLPKDYLNQNDATVVADNNFYVITIKLSDAVLMISGDRTYQREIVSGGEELKANMKRAESKFLQSEGIMSTDFHRHGVNYILSIECTHPNSDKRCTRETFLKKMYNDLVLIGGQR